MNIKKALKITSVIILGIGLLIVASFFITRKLDNDAAEASLHTPAYRFSQPLLLPSFFLDGARFYFKLRLVTGDTALAYGDSGGGICMLSPAAIDKFHLSSYTNRALAKGIMPMRYIPFHTLVPDEHIPGPVALNSFILRRPFSRVLEPALLVPPEDKELTFIMKVQPFDIFLGQIFFMNKAWTFDYLNKQLWVNTPVNADEAGKPGVLKLGFKKNSDGQKIYGHPSMQMVVDSEQIDVLFDCGATIIPSDDGKKQLQTTAATIGGSFIAKSIADKWHAKHPDWKYYVHADMAGDVIEVPKVRVAGIEAGPVLFAVRQDEVWSEGMIHTMDRVVKGALGGSCLKYFKVMIDYNSELIRFQQ